MPELPHLLAFIAASAVLGITPGPDLIYVITRGAAQGARAGMAAAAGLATGIIGHTLLCVVGVSAIVAASAMAFTAIKLLGAAYLIYLGIRMWRDRSALDFEDTGTQADLPAIFRQTVLMNILNPKVAIFFLAFLPQFVTTTGGSVATQLAVLGTTFMIVSFIVMSLAGLAGGLVRNLLVRDRRVGQWVQRGAGGVLVGLGVGLAFQIRS